LFRSFRSSLFISLVTDVLPPAPKSAKPTGTPIRGLSVRKVGPALGLLSAPPQSAPTTNLTSDLNNLNLDNNSAGKAAGTGKSKPEQRLTESYDNYLDSYSSSDKSEPPLPTGYSIDDDGPGSGIPLFSGDRLYNERERERGYGPQRAQTLSRLPSRSAPPSYGSSSIGGSDGSMRRRLTRRQTSCGSRAPSSYYKEEEGYGSGKCWYEEYEYGFDMAKIRVKVRIIIMWYGYGY
jgi:hypothetical protein